MILVVIIFFILLFFFKNNKERFIEIKKSDQSAIENVNINENYIHDVLEFNENLEKKIFNMSLNSKQNTQLLRLQKLKQELEDQSSYVDKLLSDKKTVKYYGPGNIYDNKEGTGKLGEQCGGENDEKCLAEFICIAGKDDKKRCSIRPETPSDVFRHVNNFYIDSEGKNSNFLKLSNKLFQKNSNEEQEKSN